MLREIEALFFLFDIANFSLIFKSFNAKAINNLNLRLYEIKLAIQLFDGTKKVKARRC